MTTLLLSPAPTRHAGVGLGIATGVLLALVVLQDPDLSRFSSALGVAVFGLLAWRIASTWDHLTDLERPLALLLALSPLAAAVVTYAVDAATPGALDTGWVWLLVAHRAACLVLVACWPLWLGRRR